MSKPVKRIDNAIRGINVKLQRVANKLGTNSIEYKNLVSQLAQTFGTGNIRVNKSGVSQVARGKAAQKYTNAQIKTGRSVSLEFNLSATYQKNIRQLQQANIASGKPNAPITTQQVKNFNTLKNVISEFFDKYAVDPNNDMSDLAMLYNDSLQDIGGIMTVGIDDLQDLARQAVDIMNNERDTRSDQMSIINDMIDRDELENVDELGDYI